MAINYSELRRQTRIASLLTGLSSVVVLGSLFYLFQRIAVAYKELGSVQVTIEKKKEEEEKLNIEISEKQRQYAAAIELINHYVAGEPPSAIATAIQASPGAANYVQRVYVQIPSGQDRTTADKAANYLRGLGYVVPSVETIDPSKAPLVPELRFFYTDQQAKSDINKLTRAIQNFGVDIQAHLVSTSPSPPQRQYELRFGSQSSEVHRTAVQNIAEGGIGPLKFGSSTDEIVDELAGIVPHYPWSNLVPAPEYLPADVRYFMVPLGSLSTTATGEAVLSALPDFASCESNDNSLILLFSSDHLVRVVMRLGAKCGSCLEIMQKYAATLGASINTTASIASPLFFKHLHHVNFACYRSSAGDINLDISVEGTPEPGRTR